MKEKRHFIYILKDPRLGKEKTGYIGVSINPNKRFRQHLSPHNLKENTLKDTWIKAILFLGLEPIMEILFETDNFSRKNDEIEIIAFYKIQGWDLKNGTIGGDGTVGYKFTDEQKKRNSESKKGRKFSEEHKLRIGLSGIGRIGPFRGTKGPMHGKHHSEETKNKLSVLNKGKKGFWVGKHFSEEHKKKLSESHKGHHPLTEFKKGNIPWTKGKHFKWSEARRLSYLRRFKPNEL